MRIRELGTYRGESADVEFSVDLGRARILACTAAKDRVRDCEVGVYDLATGELVHRTPLAGLAVDESGDVDVELGPGGRYFVLQRGYAPIDVYEAATGKKVFHGPDEDAADVRDTAHATYQLLDETRILTVALDGHVQRITDVATGTTRTLKRTTFASASDPAHAQLSPDRKRLVTSLPPYGQQKTLVVWNLENGAAHDYGVPEDVCTYHPCQLRWSGARTIVVAGEAKEGDETQLVIDTETFSTRTEPIQKPSSIEDFEADPVNGTFDRYDPKGWHIEKGALVSPAGARFELPQLAGNTLTASRDRFLVSGAHALRVLAADGRTAEIPR